MDKKLNVVLLVDDDEDDNYLYKLVIERAGVAYQKEVAENGLEALAYLTRKVQGNTP